MRAAGRAGVRKNFPAVIYQGVGWTYLAGGTSVHDSAFNVPEGFSLDTFTINTAPLTSSSGSVPVSITGQNTGNTGGSAGYNRLRFQAFLGINGVVQTYIGGGDFGTNQDPHTVATTVSKSAGQNDIIIQDNNGNIIAIYRLYP